MEPTGYSMFLTLKKLSLGHKILSLYLCNLILNQKSRKINNNLALGRHWGKYLTSKFPSWFPCLILQPHPHLQGTPQRIGHFKIRCWYYSKPKENRTYIRVEFIRKKWTVLFPYCRCTSRIYAIQPFGPWNIIL